jgi:hypothetical protein
VTRLRVWGIGAHLLFWLLLAMLVVMLLMALGELVRPAWFVKKYELQGLLPPPFMAKWHFYWQMTFSMLFYLATFFIRPRFPNKVIDTDNPTAEQRQYMHNLALFCGPVLMTAMWIFWSYWFLSGVLPKASSAHWGNPSYF